jgi:hypothetical protein
LKYHNHKELQELFLKSKRGHLVTRKHFDIDEEKFKHHREQLQQHHEHLSDKHLDAHAVYRVLTHGEAADESIVEVHHHHIPHWSVIAYAVVVLLLLLLVLFRPLGAHGQTSVTVKGVTKGTTGANTATVTSYDSNHNGADVNCLNCTSASGGTSSNFGAAFPAAGTAIGASDGTNMQNLVVDASKFLKVNCAVGCSGSSFADNTAFTFGTTAISVLGGVLDDVATNAATENSAAAARITSDRMLYMNLGKVGGTATDTNSGVKSAGTLRVVLATDQPQLSNKLLVTPDSVALPANQSVNVSQLAGTTTDTNSGTKVCRHVAGCTGYGSAAVKQQAFSHS